MNAQRRIISGLALFLLVMSLVACSGGFVSLEPAPGAKPEKSKLATDGYLRVYIWSDLTALEQKAANYTDFDSELEDLAVTVEPLVGTNSAGEYPIANFNLETRVKETIASIDVNKAQYVNLESGNQPSFKFHVRAVPKSFVTAYKQAVAQVSDIASALPTQTISSWAPQLQSATKVLSVFADAADAKKPKEWTSEWTVGLKASDNGELPLNDTPYKMYLVPTGKDLDMATLTQGAHSCAANASRLCTGLAGAEAPFAAVPYLTIRATITDYRPISDFTYDITCDRTADELGEIRATLARAKLLQKQRIYEGYLVDRLSALLEMQVKNALSTVNGVADFAYRRLVAFRSVSGDTLWKDHYVESAAALEDCIDKVPQNQGFIAARRWGRMQAAIQTAIGWQDAYSKASLNSDADRMTFLERDLARLQEPFQFGLEKSGDVYQEISSEGNRVEALLRPLYEGMRKDVPNESVDQLNGTIQRLKDNPSRCESCQQLIAAIGDEVQAALQKKMPPAKQALQPVAEVSSQLKLAELLGSAKHMAVLADDFKVDSAPLTLAIEQGTAALKAPDKVKVDQSKIQIQNLADGLQAQLRAKK